MQILILAILISFIVSLGGGRGLIPLLRKLKAGQQIRDDGPESHLSKAGTPTMGGIFITFGVLATAAVFYKYESSYMVFALIGALAYGLIGLIDDFIIVLKKRSEGLKPYQKILMQIIFASLISVYAYRDSAIGSSIFIPIANINLELGAWYIPFNIFAILALTNSVNLTDGLDGLAGGVSIINTATYALIFFGMTSAFVWRQDMIIFAAAVTGATLGFLRYNTYPAKVFMGDTGAFFLGGALVMMAIISRLQILIPIMGIMFVLSSLSCVLQVGSYKLRKKRIFRMAPLHHHFELGGVREPKIVASYMMATVIACLLTLLIMSWG